MALLVPPLVLLLLASAPATGAQGEGEEVAWPEPARDVNLALLGRCPHLQLQVTWSPPADGVRPLGYDVTVALLAAEGASCADAANRHASFETHSVSAEAARSLTFGIGRVSSSARDEGLLRVAPGCAYEAKVEPQPYAGGVVASARLSVPPCPPNACTRRPTPPARLTAALTPPLLLQVTWINDNNGTRVEIIVEAKRFHSNAGRAVFQRVWGPGLLALGAGAAEVALPPGAVRAEGGDGTLRLQATAVDGQGCRSDAVEVVLPPPVTSPSATMEQTQDGAGQHTGVHSSDHAPESGRLRRRGRRSWPWAAALAVGAVAAVGVAAALLLRRRWRRNKRRRADQFGAARLLLPLSPRAGRQVRNVLYVPQPEAEGGEGAMDDEQDAWEVDPETITLHQQVGRGAFGVVFAGTCSALAGVGRVAVKTLPAGAGPDEVQDLLAEAKVLRRAGRHPHVVALLGCVTRSLPLALVLELVAGGDLLRYLRSLRAPASPASTDASAPDTEWSLLSSCEGGAPCVLSPPSPSPSPSPALDARQLQDFAVQIARGMAHLESRGITHRDLATRNVLVDLSSPSSPTLKISDFGLSRDGAYVVDPLRRRGRKVPLRWLAPEALCQRTYSSRSDAWAFAVVLWEIGTLGGFPYPTVADKNLLDFLLEGNRLEKPDNISQELYSLMLQCWSHSPDKRPSFAEIVDQLETVISHKPVYVNFHPNYTFPPIKQAVSEMPLKNN